MRFSTVFFDLDGTLTDPEQGICKSIIHALEKGGYPHGEISDYHNWIGPPLIDSFIGLLGVGNDEANRLLGFYRERFSTVGLFENTVYPGISGMLSNLKNAGLTLAVCTGKPTVYSEQILRHFDLDCYFNGIFGIGLDEEGKTKDETLREALAALGLDTADGCIMVGDRIHDIDGAAKAGLQSVYVTYGYGNENEAAHCAPTFTVHSVKELEKVLLA